MKISKTMTLDFLALFRKRDNGTVLDKVNFAAQLRYERERSERTNNPFSLICIDLSKTNEYSNGKDFEKILDIISSSIRTVDRVGWIRKNLIGIILPDTPTVGAVTVAKKLEDRLNQRQSNSSFSECFIVSTYPDTPGFYDFDKNIIGTQTYEFKNKIS